MPDPAFPSPPIAPLVERPAEHPAHVVPVIVLATLLGLVAKNPLIDADVAIIAKMRLNDVIEIDASRRPLRQRRRRQPKGCNGGNDYRESDTDAARQATISQGPLEATETGAKSSNAPDQATHAYPPPELPSNPIRAATTGNNESDPPLSAVRIATLAVGATQAAPTEPYCRQPNPCLPHSRLSADRAHVPRRRYHRRPLREA